MTLPESLDANHSPTYVTIIPAVGVMAIFKVDDGDEDSYPVIAWGLRKRKSATDLLEVMEGYPSYAYSYTDVVGLVFMEGEPELYAVDDPLFGDFLRYE